LGTAIMDRLKISGKFDICFRQIKEMSGKTLIEMKKLGKNGAYGGGNYSRFFKIGNGDNWPVGNIGKFENRVRKIREMSWKTPIRIK